MTGFAELEIRLQRWDAESYDVSLRYSYDDDEKDLTQDRPIRIQIDFVGLRELGADGRAYGRALAASLFGGPVGEHLANVRRSAQQLGAQLRVRLFIPGGAPELHGILWETLRHPGTDEPLLTSENVLLSRYLSSDDWRRVQRRSKRDLRALVVIANPRGLERNAPGGRPLTPLNVEAELARAKQALRDVPVTELASPGSATLLALTDKLRDGYDLLYLVCHGALIDAEPYLWLESDAGEVAQVEGRELVTRIRELIQVPRLAVLASCQSAGAGAEGLVDDGGALAALGPRLAEAGIPAVLAMQGSVTIPTVEQFMPKFFEELQRDGQIDRAMAVARGVVRDRPDYWMPVLFMRLKSGRLWFTPGFSDEKFERWPSLLTWIREGLCTPILGPGLAEALLGSRREIARRWAEQYQFPLALSGRDDLPQVAQFLAVDQRSTEFPKQELLKHIRRELVERYGSRVSSDLHRGELGNLAAAAWAEVYAPNSADPHRVLAQLPFPIYITTGPGNTLVEALERAGRPPKVVLCPWNEWVELPELDAEYYPDIDHPLVYHAFGRFENLDSLVITEDDYFDYLIGITGLKQAVPSVVNRALASTALLFLGFQPDDWNFRVLFRSIMGLQGRARRQKYTHVAVQLDPDESTIIRPEAARSYLEKYLLEGANISVYWGSVEDFARDLIEKWEQHERDSL